MRRLIEKGLMFGNLVPVTSPALVERYNRALKSLTGKVTKLDDFHIDISGYSPEIGDEFSDTLYLNQNGCNRQFILLSTAQKSAPLLNAKFSMSRPILHQFITENEAALFALTTKDAVAGELENSVYDLSAPGRLFEIQRIRVEADTTGSHVAEGRKLTQMIEQFRTKDDAWWDDVLIGKMIGLAKSTGDVTRNPVQLDPLDVDPTNFWTAHFGGLYVYRDLEHPAAISVGPKEDLGKIPIRHLFDLSDRNKIARFLDLNELVEPIVRAKNVDAAAILGQKMDFILIDAVALQGLDISGATPRDLRHMARKMGADLPAEFRALAALKRWAESGGDWPKINSQHPAYFYTLRARGGAHRDLVNQMLAELAPLDVRQLFICHKQLFYDHYSDWAESKKEYVANFLGRAYQANKAGVREALFGPEDEVELPTPKVPEDIVDIVGPWGAVRRSR
ncbi:MAG: hypothetical protein KUG69_05410 [Marinosulfonomonas sp.]|nr:hypothetical protein [Marinosulfonomonas sp.]